MIKISGFAAPLMALWLLGVVAISLPATVHASTGDAGAAAAEVPEALSPESISDLVSRMSPEQTGALSALVEVLDRSIEDGLVTESAHTTSVMEAVSAWIAGFGSTIVEHVIDFPAMIVDVFSGFASLFAGKGVSGTLIFFALMAVVVGVGLGVERLFDRVLAKKREEIRLSNPDSLPGTLKVLSMRAAIEIGDVIVFVVTALLVARMALTNPDDYLIAKALIIRAILTYRLVAALLKFILAPKRTELRLVSADDWTAQYMYRNLVALAAVVGIGFFLGAVMNHFQLETADTFRFWLSLLGHGWIIHVTWKARHGLTSIIIGEEENLTTGLARMATWWPPISIGILVFNWFLVQFIVSTGYEGLSPVKGAVAVLLIVSIPFLDTIVRGVAGHLVPEKSGIGAVAEKAQEARRHSYVRIGRVILLVVAVLAIGKLWGFSLRNIAETGLGAQIASNIVGFLVILAFGYIAWEVTNLVINRKLAEEMEASGMGEEGEGGEGGGAGQTRVATVLPIVRLTLQATIITLTVLLALSQLGVNITPLLAGAGVLGLAIGFGAQTLVKDIVSGVFFLLDDAFRQGEYIDIGGTAGTVEKISVRSMHLRGVTGPVHVVPYGSVSTLTNHSRDWVIMKLRFTIPFDTDLEKVRKLFKKIGQQMLEEPELADKFLEPFKGQGAADVTDVGIVVRGKFTTRPGDQWQIRKEVYNRVQKAFEENGIEFARKEVWVQLADSMEGTDLTAEQKKSIAAAASQAAEDADKPARPTAGDDR